MSRIIVRAAGSSEQKAALELLFAEADNPQEETEATITLVRRGELSLNELLLAELAGRLVGAGLLTEQPGRVGFVWPPGVPVSQPERSRIQEAILAAIGRRMDELKLCLGQVLLDPGDSAARELFERNGFPHLTDLHYMVCSAKSSPTLETPTRFETETFDAETNAERFARVLERTYAHTLDCPELDGLRTPQEALAAHRATGRFDPDFWWLFHRGQTDAGLLLLNEHPQNGIWEIAYLGVVPEARGQGLGRQMVHIALATALRKKQSLVLAVDARNHVAIKIYKECGFLDLTVHSVHLRQAAGAVPIPQSTDYAQPPETRERKS